MLAALFLASVALAAADTIVPVYEDPNVDHIDEESDYSCVSDCHHHILNDEVFVLLRDHNNEEIPYTRVYAPRGLNGLLSTPLKEKILNHVVTQNFVGIIHPAKSFRSELYPGVTDAEVIIPEHTTTLKKLHQEKPVFVMMSKEEFGSFNANKGYTPIVDLNLSSTGFHISKDYAPVNRNLVKPKPRFGFDIHFNP